MRVSPTNGDKTPLVGVLSPTNGKSETELACWTISTLSWYFYMQIKKLYIVISDTILNAENMEMNLLQRYTISTRQCGGLCLVKLTFAENLAEDTETQNVDLP